MALAIGNGFNLGGSGYDSDFLGETSDASQAVTNETNFDWKKNLMNPLEWQFLNEPAYKWAAFFIMLSAFAVMWRGVLRHMK